MEILSAHLLEKLFPFFGKLLAVGIKGEAVEQPQVLLYQRHLKKKEQRSESAQSPDTVSTQVRAPWGHVPSGRARCSAADWTFHRCRDRRYGFVHVSFVLRLEDLTHTDIPAQTSLFVSELKSFSHSRQFQFGPH